MKKAMTMAAALVAMLACAQEFGAESTAETAPAGQVDASMVVEAQEAEPDPAPTAEELLREWINSKEDLSLGHDEENGRIIVLDYTEFDVKDPRVSADFIKIRTGNMTELLLKAKSTIIETIMSEMSAERILDLPGNPIAKQLAKEQEELYNALKVASEDLVKLSEDLKTSLEDRDRMSANEILSVISSWFTSADKENLAEKYTVEKKAAYTAAREKFRAAQKQYDELIERAEEVKGTISKELTTETSRISSMPIYGCTILQQAESFAKQPDGKYKCQLAVIYAWSKEMQQAAGEILKGESMTFTPGKRSVKKWLSAKAKNGALSQWCGPRQYIDDKGNMWFLGIACTPVYRDSSSNNMEVRKASLLASTEVMFSLYSDAASSQTLKTLLQERMGSGGEKEQKVFEDYAVRQQESFKNIQISGNAPLYTGKVRHQASGLDINVAVYGVSSGSAKALKSIQSAAVALGIEVNTAQEVERGRQAQLRQSFEASKTNASARAVGAAKAKQEIADEAAKAKARREQRTRQAATFKEDKSVTGGAKTKGQLRAGSTFIEDDDE